MRSKAHSERSGGICFLLTGLSELRVPPPSVFWNQRLGSERRQVFELKWVTGKVFICQSVTSAPYGVSSSSPRVLVADLGLRGRRPRVGKLIVSDTFSIREGVKDLGHNARLDHNVR